MKPILVFPAIIGLSLLAPFAAYAQGGLFGGPGGLDPHFCKPHPIRQTVVYVDDTILVTGQTAWAMTIYNKLRATLIPGEPVTLVELSSSNGQSKEIWSGCWPAYTAEERAALAKETHLFSPDPLSALGDQQKFFVHDFGVAAEAIQQKGQRSAEAVAIDPANPPQKSIIRALASDGARYAHTANTIRAILYSDLAENSDLGSVYKPPADPPQQFGIVLGTYLRRSVFYAFGVGTDIRGGGRVVDNIRSFWDQGLRSMAANVNGLGSDLNVPNSIPVTSAVYDVTLVEKDGQNLTGRLSLLADADGLLVDSWIGITRLHNVSINGTYRCAGAADASSCRLQATTIGGLVTTFQTETITLSSHNGTTLTGKIGVQDSDFMLPLAAAPATD